MGSKELTYKIHGDAIQFLCINLAPAESIIAEPAALMAMDEKIQLQTMLGDEDQHKDTLSKVLGAGKRWATGESVFQTIFTNKGTAPQSVYLTPPHPARILSINLAGQPGSLICRRGAFLCATRGTNIDVAYQKKISASLFGGEGLMMQRLSGEGQAFIYSEGAVLERTLAGDETLRVGTGRVVAWDSTVTYEVERVTDVKSALFTGEGMFLDVLRGPGKIWIQNLPLSK